jgi:hypothetical protein
VVLLRDEWGRRRIYPGDHHIELTRQCGDHIPSQPQHLGSPVESPEEQPELDQRSDLVQLKLEAGDHAEVATATPDGPEQLRIFVRSDSQDPAVGHDHLRRNEVVDGESELAGQPSHAATQRQPTHTGVADQTGGCRQPMSLRGGVHIGQQCTPPTQARRRAGLTVT